MYKNRSGDEGAKQDWRGAKDDVDPSLTLCHPIYICDHMSGEQIRFATHAQDKSAVPNMSGFLAGCNGCGSCTEMAIAGVLSVYQNTYWHSEQETVHESCFSALYPSSTSFQEEAFRNYSKCEIILIALEYLSRFPEELCVLRIAGNHHFYWPIIHFLGSIYNACWSHWGRSLPKVSICPILLDMYPPDRTDRFVLKCGNIHCNVLDPQYNCFPSVSGAVYAATAEAKDWKLHKRACFVRKGIVEEEQADSSRIQEEETVEDALENLNISNEGDTLKPDDAIDKDDGVD